MSPKNERILRLTAIVSTVVVGLMGALIAADAADDSVTGAVIWLFLASFAIGLLCAPLLVRPEQVRGTTRFSGIALIVSGVFGIYIFVGSILVIPGLIYFFIAASA